MFISVALCSLISIFGATLEDAKRVYNKGDYAKALPLFEEQYKKSPKNASVNHWLGVCRYKTGQLDKAEQNLAYAASKNVTESSYYLALIKFHKYEFGEAEAAIDKYKSALSRLKKAEPKYLEKLSTSIREASMMLDHVEKIVILDSITVDKDRFFKAYNISKSCGSLNSASVLPEKMQAKGIPLVYASENGERMVWSAPDADSIQHLYETFRLYGGEWEDSSSLGNSIDKGCNAMYPFIMQDGLTLYFASDADSSIGGLDIYMTRKDIETGEYLQPQNVGMPYNSPYDDYMLVIDEERNVGWWATDRNQIPGKVTIYCFIPNKTRVNYSADDERIIEKALITDYHHTWEDNDYSEKVSELHNISTDAFISRTNFSFNVYNGIVYKNLSDFKTQEGASMMEELLAMEKKLDANLEKLRALRRKYEIASANERISMKGNILQLENAVDKSRIDIRWMENSIRKAENK